MTNPFGITQLLLFFLYQSSVCNIMQLFISSKWQQVANLEQVSSKRSALHFHRDFWLKTCTNVSIFFR